MSVIPFPHKMRAKQNEPLPEIQKQEALISMVQSMKVIDSAAITIGKNAQAMLTLMNEHKVSFTPDEWVMLANVARLCVAIKQVSSGATDEKP